MSEKKYPYPCCRCGLCCLIGPCPMVIAHYIFRGFRAPDTRLPCPLLSFEENDAICGLYDGSEWRKKDLGIGVGCCIKARVFKKGEGFNFDQLPPYLKKAAAREIKEKINARRI